MFQTGFAFQKSEIKRPNVRDTLRQAERTMQGIKSERERGDRERKKKELDREGGGKD